MLEYGTGLVPPHCDFEGGEPKILSEGFRDLMPCMARGRGPSRGLSSSLRALVALCPETAIALCIEPLMDLLLREEVLWYLEEHACLCQLRPGFPI